VFHLTWLSPQRIAQQVEAAQQLPPACPILLTLNQGLTARVPCGFALDISRTQIGHGPQAFAAAHHAFAQWLQFDLGWVRVANPTARIAVGMLIAVEAHTAGLWSLNFSRVTETIDTFTRFGFLYSTTRHHIEEGQERFILEYDPATGALSYLIEAVSRPRHPLARLAWPYARAMQHRFARDSHARMRQAVAESTP
jgi:uncharacterized protein (UPF0548 family)